MLSISDLIDFFEDSDGIDDDRESIEIDSSKGASGFIEEQTEEQAEEQADSSAAHGHRHRILFPEVWLWTNNELGYKSE